MISGLCGAHERERGKAAERERRSPQGGPGGLDGALGHARQAEGEGLPGT